MRDDSGLCLEHCALRMTRSQQLGLLVLGCALVVYVFVRLLLL
jgi:hypothetical protein